MVLLGILFTIFAFVCGVALAIALALAGSQDNRQEYMSRINNLGEY